MMPEHRGSANPHSNRTSWYTTRVDASTGPVPVRVIEPRGRTAGWLVWAHGGSWHRGHRNPSAFPQADTLTAAWRSYRGSRPGRHPAHYSTPLESPDLTGAAPAIIAVGALDPVVDDVRDYRERLRNAGVPVRYQEFATTAHGAFLTPTFARSEEPSLRQWLGISLRAALHDRTVPSSSAQQGAER